MLRIRKNLNEIYNLNQKSKCYKAQCSSIQSHKFVKFKITEADRSRATSVTNPRFLRELQRYDNPKSSKVVIKTLLLKIRRTYGKAGAVRRDAQHT